jgi:hypothetical protein
MARFIDTTGLARIAIGICGRCSQKFPMVDLREDPNTPGLLVCEDDWDNFDPYRLPPRQPEQLVKGDLRPDVNVTDESPTPKLYAAAMQFKGITSVGPVAPWRASTNYAMSASVTPQNIDDQNVDLPQYWFVCISPGKSGAKPPIWTTAPGTTVNDGTVVWFNYGIYPN